MEQYAACAYSHFLSYGLKLRERDEFSFEARKLGSAFHDSLMVYGNLLKERNLSWTEVTTEERENIIAEAMEKAINMGDYGAIYSSFRSTYMKERLKRILNRSVDTLTCHLKQGSFLPFRYELPFYPGNGLQSFVIDLSEDESLQLVGRIDRIDTCEDDENVYVKVIDYKSGDETLELSEVYKGLRLQLVVYLSVALEYVKHLGSETKNVLPAGTLYYHIDDPIVDVILTEGKEENAEETEKRIRDKLRMKGLVNSEKKIYSLLDKELASDGVRSSIVPVRLKADGTFYEDSGVVSSEDFVVLSDFAEEKLKELGRGILAGDIRAARKEKDQSEDCCGWCLYKTICKRKGNSAGVKDVSEKKSRREILALMKEKIDGRV